MGWTFLFLIAALVIVGLWRWGGLGGSVLQFVVAALFVGVAGYAWQGHPWLDGRAKSAEPAEAKPKEDSVFATQRFALMGRFGRSAQVLDAADAMHRAGLD